MSVSSRFAAIALAVLALQPAPAPAGAQMDEPLPPYMQRYAKEGPPKLEPIAELTDANSPRPRFRGALAKPPVAKIEPGPLALSDADAKSLREVVLQNPQVRDALGKRFVYLASGFEVSESKQTQEPASLAIEFYSYTRQRAVTVEMKDAKTVGSVVVRPPDYVPGEGREEVRNAAAIATKVPEIAAVAKNLEVRGILTPCQESRCIYLQLRRNGKDVVTATVDLVAQKVREYHSARANKP